MVGADIVSTHHARFAGVAERFQHSEHPVSAASSEVSAVLKSEPARAAIADQADGFEVESRTLAIDPAPFGVGDRDVLARRAADDDVGEHPKIRKKSSCREGPDVFVEKDMRVVLRVEDAAPFDDFAGGHGDETGAMQAERPAAGRRAEQVERAHHGWPRRTGGDILLRLDGWPKVERVLKVIDGIEALDIDPVEIPPEHWRHIHNRLIAGHEPRAYSRAQHSAWLLRREAGK